MAPAHPLGCFVTATGTGVGKTLISRALVHALRLRGWSVCAVKPLETGCDPDPEDALALAQACNRSELAHHPGFYRAVSPLAPAAAALLDIHPPPSVSSLTQACLACCHDADYLLVEGAGGLLVPINDQETVADLMAAVGLPALLIASDTLGTLSHTLCAYESLERRAIPVAAVVLNRCSPRPPLVASGPASNLALLQARLPIPVLATPHCPQVLEPEILANLVEDNGLLAVLLSSPTF